MKFRQQQQRQSHLQMLHNQTSHSQQLLRRSATSSTCHCQQWRTALASTGHLRSFPSSPERQQRSRAGPVNQRRSLSGAVFGAYSSRNSRSTYAGGGRSSNRSNNNSIKEIITTSSSSNSSSTRLLTPTAPVTPRVSSLVPPSAHHSSSYSTAFSPVALESFDSAAGGRYRNAGSDRLP